MAKFSKGWKGGPGRPKLSEPEKLEKRAAKAIAEEHASEAMDRLIHWMRSSDAKASLPASVAIIERAEGKPTQPLNHSGQLGTYAAQPIPVEQRNPLEGAAGAAANGDSTSRH